MFGSASTDLRLPIDQLPRALLIESDADTRHMYTDYLRLANFDIEEASDGRDALRRGPGSRQAVPAEALLTEVNRVLDRAQQLQVRATELRARLSDVLQRADEAVKIARTVKNSVPLSHAHRRGDTTAPPIAAPDLLCPVCDKPLAYRRSHVGGVSARHPEQWDYYECTVSACGTFQYRQRTRKLRRV